MCGPAIPSIDQLLVLLAVAEAGSFTGAAKRLGRATSAVSYAIDTLERDLVHSLFDRGTIRKPKLTQKGEAIVSEARAVAHSIETLRARVRGFLDELEPEVSVVVDSMLPSHRLTTLLVYSTLSSRRCRFVSRCRPLAVSSAWSETAMLASAWEASCIWT
jgi:DNA-binding transcriptional LysR family regulator